MTTAARRRNKILETFAFTLWQTKKSASQPAVQGVGKTYLEFAYQLGIRRALVARAWVAKAASGPRTRPRTRRAKIRKPCIPWWPQKLACHRILTCTQYQLAQKFNLRRISTFAEACNLRRSLPVAEARLPMWHRISTCTEACLRKQPACHRISKLPWMPTSSRCKLPGRPDLSLPSSPPACPSPTLLPTSTEVWHRVLSTRSRPARGGFPSGPYRKYADNRQDTVFCEHHPPDRNWENKRSMGRLKVDLLIINELMD